MRTRAALRSLGPLLLAAALAAPMARATPQALAQARSELARDRLVDVLTLLRPDEGHVAVAERAEAARLLAQAATLASEKGRPALALQLAEASFEHDPAQPAVLKLLGQWSLDDGRPAQARRYSELWLGVAPKDPAARDFHEKVKAAPPPAQLPLWERAKALLGIGQPKASADRSLVTLYTTSWCPVCKRAKEWLRLKRVAFVERDVEQEPAARTELAAAAQRQGIAQRGVPVLEANGQLAEGFSEQSYKKLLRLGE